MPKSFGRQLTRRDFLFQTSVVALSGGLLPGCALVPPTAPEIFAVGGIGSDIVAKNLSGSSDLFIRTSVVSHSILPHPLRRELVLGVEKSGGKLALADLKKGLLLRELDAGTHRVFYGHAAFSPDGRRFWSTQVDTSSGLGHLREYSFPNFEILSDTQIAVGGVHDLLLLPDRKILVMTSSGVRHKYELGRETGPKSGERIEKSSVLFIDTATKKIVERQFLEDESLICGHLALAGDGRVFCITTLFEDYRGPKKSPHGSIVWTRQGERFREVAIPDSARSKLHHEFLSIAVNDDKGIFAATNPRGNLLLEFDLKTLALKNAHESKSTGVAYNPLNSGELLILPKVPFLSAHWTVVNV